jgi:hypothetical protein
VAIPPDADKRLAEVRRALKKLANHREVLKRREEIFSGCPYNERWQRDMLQRFIKEGILEKGDHETGSDVQYKFVDGISIARYFELETLSEIIWPAGQGLVGTQGSTPALPDDELEEYEEPEETPPLDDPEPTLVSTRNPESIPSPREGDELLMVLGNLAQLVAEIHAGQQEMLATISGKLEIAITAAHYVAASQKEMLERLSALEKMMEEKHGHGRELDRGVQGGGEHPNREREGDSRNQDLEHSA